MGIIYKSLKYTKRIFYKILNLFKIEFDLDRLETISKSAIYTELYYLFINKSFQREKQSVLQGIVSFQNKVDRNIFNQSLLTRNIHRIEKGLIMKNVKNVFALDYINETLNEYKKINKDISEDNYYKWYTNVLEKYFNTVDINIPFLSKMYKEFLECKLEFKINDEVKSIPRTKRLLSTISYDDFYKLNMQRRSVRWFDDKHVPRELIDKALLVANQAPSACNRQPFSYHIIDDSELLKKAVQLPPGISGYTDNIKTLIILIGNLDSYFSERDRHLIYIDASLSAMAFILALETLGLSSVCINWPDIDSIEMQMKELLNLETHHRPIMCIAVGYNEKEGLVPFSEKKSLQDLRKYY
jgi:nitroreductase